MSKKRIPLRHAHRQDSPACQVASLVGLEMKLCPKLVHELCIVQLQLSGGVNTWINERMYWFD
jgi:hypothetical protein